MYTRSKGKSPLNPSPPPNGRKTTLQLSIRTEVLKLKELQRITDFLSDNLVSFFRIETQPIEIEFVSKTNLSEKFVEYKVLYTLDLEQYSVPSPEDKVSASSDSKI